MVAMASVMFKSAFMPRIRGSVICSLWWPGSAQPMVPNPGIRPNQLANKIKMKAVAKNQKVRWIM